MKNINNFDIFKQAIMKYFSYLEKDFSFKLVWEAKENNIYQFKYKSNIFFVEIFFSEVQNEVDFAFGLLDDNKQKFTAGDLLVICPEGGKQWKMQDINDLNNIEKNVAYYAFLFNFFFQNYFLKDSKKTQDLKLYWNNKVEESKSKDLFMTARKKAECAWKNKSYLEVIIFYEAFEESLSRVEKLRLNYAKKHLEKK